MRKLRLGAYRRVSRQGTREDERLRSPEFQMELMRRLEATENVELVEYPAEVDVSGAKKKRDVLDRIIADVEAGELDGIAVARLDRLSRLRPKDRVELVERIEDAGGVIRSASEQLDGATPEGRFARDVFLGVARMQWEQKALDFEQAKANAIVKGIAIMGTAPFGTKFTKGHGLEVEPKNAAILLELYVARSEGASYGRLAELFLERTGRDVPRSTLKGMLENRVYIGEMKYGELVNEAAGVEIIPLELFEAVQAVNRARSAGRGVAVNRAKSLLAGIAKCAGCGRGLMNSKTSADGRRRYYCRRDYPCSARANITADVLDEYVLETVLEWAGDVADELVEVELDVGGEAERLVAERRLEQAETAQAEYEADVELELEVGAMAYKRGRQARAELVERRRAELEALGEASELEVARTTLRRALTNGELEVDERRRLLAVVLEAVIVRKTPRRMAPASERAEVVFRA